MVPYRDETFPLKGQFAYSEGGSDRICEVAVHGFGDGTIDLQIGGVRKSVSVAGKMFDLERLYLGAYFFAIESRLRQDLMNGGRSVVRDLVQRCLNSYGIRVVG